MWRRAFPVRLAFMVGVITAGTGGRVLAQQPTPLPFDQSLSIYAGHDGTWNNYTADEQEEAEIEDPLAAFQAHEAISDDPETWGNHQINDPEVPQGWTFFTPVAEEPMDLHVIVRDTQNRLDELEITDRDTGAYIGTLVANCQGSEIDGSVSVEPLAEAFNLEIKAKDSGNTLFRAGANNPRVDDAVPVTLPYGWEANRGDDHEECPVTGLGPPWGDPESVEGKESTGMPMDNDACGGPVQFTNDTADAAGPITAKYNLLDKKIVQDSTTGFEPGNLAPKAMQAVQGALTAARQPYQGGNVFLSGLELLPYSEGVAHWPMTLIGELNAVLYYPYRGRTTRKAEIAVSLEAKAQEEWGAGVGTQTPAQAVVLAIKATYGPGDEKMYQAGEPEAVGEVWGLRASSATGPSAMPETGITSQVTIELWADKLPPPPGAPGFIGGSGTVNLDEASTEPAPPHPMLDYMDLEFPSDGDDKGKCTVALAKGWKWKATGQPMDMGYDGGEVGPFGVPGQGNPRIECELVTLLCLKIKTVSEGGENVEAYLELQKQGQGGGWATIETGWSTEQPNGEYIWFPAAPLPPGTYRVRAQGMGPWSDWHEFAVLVAIEQTETVTVPEEDMPPGEP